MSIKNLQKSLLRRQLRTNRKSLTTRVRFKYHKQILSRLYQAGILKHHYIALYYSFDGEVDTQHIIKVLLSYGKQLYFPKLNGETLIFTKIHTHTLSNIYGIAQSTGKRLPTKRLTLVITPLVGFDTKRNRLGMGGGYYDKTFAYLKHSSSFIHPKRYAIAYELQRTILTPQQWDVRLDKVITESAIY